MTQRKNPLSGFFENSYKDKSGKLNVMYLMNRKGFSLVAMGFTGSKALKWKIKYIEAFDEMEEKLKNQVQTNISSYQIEDKIERAKRWIEEETERRQLTEENKELNEKLEIAEPKVDYCDVILKSKNAVLITQIAQDYGVTSHKFNKILEECGIQYNRNGTWILYAKYAGKGYTKSETEPYEGKDGSQYSKIHTKWTQKGRMFLYMELQKHNIFPTMDLKK